MLGWLSTATAMTPLREILGAKAAKKVKDALGDTSVGELLRRLPQRYATQGHSLNVDYAQVGESITAVVPLSEIHRGIEMLQTREGNPIRILVQP